MSEQTPLFELASGAGAKFAEDAGWRMPVHFGDPTAEYRAAREQAVLFDVSHRGKVELAGKDAVLFLHNLCTNDINRLTVGTGCEAFLTTGQAKVVAYALVERLRLDEGREVLWLDVAPGLAGKVVQHLDHFLISEQVEIADRTQEFAQLHLAGPHAKTILDQACRDGLPKLQELHHTMRSVGAASSRVRRQDVLGLPGYDVICLREQAPGIWQSLIHAGARPAGLQAYQILRVEAGAPLYGVDIDDNNLPQEVGRTEKAISFTKGCYIGQETIARIRTYGHVNRSLVGLKLAGDTAAPSGAKLFQDGKEMGQVTSSVVSPQLGKAIALGYVRRGCQEPGTALEVEIEGMRWTAEVVSLPLSGSGAGTGP